MTHVFYTFKSLPSGVYDPAADEPFRASLPTWRKLGLGPIVDRVSGNGLIHSLDNGTQRLCVWPAGDEFTPPTGEETTVEIDDELSVSWFGPNPPTPSDLDNGNPLRLQCVPIILADGDVWQIPEIREPRGSLLPTDLTRDRKTGKLLNPIKREFIELWQECEFWFDLKWKALAGEAKTFSLERALVFATQILGLRYRFCDATQSALRIIDSVNVQAIIETAIGWPAVIEQIRQMNLADEDDTGEKKNPPTSVEHVNGNSGPKDSDRITDQRAENNGSPPLETTG